MGKIVDNIQGVVATVIRQLGHECGVNTLGDAAAANLGITLTAYALRKLAADAARTEAKTIDGAEANTQLAQDLQLQTEQQLVDECGLTPKAANMLTSAVMMGASRFQSDLNTLRHEMLGDGPKSARFKT